MNYIQKGFLLAVVVGSVSFIHADEAQETNQMGQDLWSRKTKDQVLTEDTAHENMSNFESELSPLGLHEWYQLTPAQKKQAMDYADNSQYSPDCAVMMVSRNF